LLTPNGRDQLPVLQSRKAWGDAHVYGEAGSPVKFRHNCGADLTPRLVCDACGETVKSTDLRPSRDATAPTVGEVMAGVEA
jgi:hypothetical protein